MRIRCEQSLGLNSDLPARQGRHPTLSRDAQEREKEDRIYPHAPALGSAFSRGLHNFGGLPLARPPGTYEGVYADQLDVSDRSSME
jgi:hypothetical protein